MRAAHHHNGKCAIAAFATSSNGLFRCEEGERGEEGEKDSMKKEESLVDGNERHLSCVHDNVSLISQA